MTFLDRRERCEQHLNLRYDGLVTLPPSRSGGKGLKRFQLMSQSLPPSPPAEKTSARQDQTRQSSTGDGTWDRSQFAPDLATGEGCGVDVKIGQSAFDSRDQRRLSLRDRPHPNEGRIVDRRLCEIVELPEVKVPEVTPRGNAGKPSTAGNAGSAVATPTFWLVPGIVWQQWMCAIVSFDPKPLNVALTCIVWATGSSTIVARPVPCEALGGFSFAPERFAVKVIGSAWAAIGRISAVANASKQEPIEMPDSFMFASLAEDGHRVWFQAVEASLKSFRFKSQRVRVGRCCIFW